MYLVIYSSSFGNSSDLRWLSKLYSMHEKSFTKIHCPLFNLVFCFQLFTFSDTSSRESPFPPVEAIRTPYTAHTKKTRLALSAEEEVSSAIKRFCVSSEDKENNDSSQSSRYWAFRKFCLWNEMWFVKEKAYLIFFIYF